MFSGTILVSTLRVMPQLGDFLYAINNLSPWALTPTFQHDACLQTMLKSVLAPLKKKPLS